jgi:hypothetical protein
MIAAINALPALLDVAEAAAAKKVIYDDDGTEHPSTDEIDDALKRLEEVP